MQDLLDIMKVLREQCLWDQAQTPESLTQYAIEEAYEVEEAVRSGNTDDIRDELGDLLLQVVFQSQMYSEQGAFDFNDVVEAIVRKLTRRHPHIFQPEQFQASTPDEVASVWKAIKQKEKQNKRKSRLDEIKHGPAITQAQEIQKNAAQIGFDFLNVDDAYDKLKEELNEFEQALLGQQAHEIMDEFGDCLFSLINVGRKLGLSSEMALLSTIYKFKSRFAYIEDQAIQQHKNIEDMTLTEMDILWDQAKKILKKSKIAT